MCKNVSKSENFVPIKSGYLKKGFWRFDTFNILPQSYTSSSNYLAGLVVPSPVEGSLPLYMFYRAAPVGFTGPLPYKDEIYYSTSSEPKYGMSLTTEYPDGIVGYVYTSGGPHRVPIYELSAATATYHMWSNDGVT